MGTEKQRKGKTKNEDAHLKQKYNFPLVLLGNEKLLQAVLSSFLISIRKVTKLL
jgi:hypothetical protein